MIPRTLAGKRSVSFSGVDRRVWWLVAAIGFFAVLVMKEVQLSPLVIAAFGGVGLLGLFMAGLRSPEIPLYVLVAYLPFSKILVGDFGTQAAAFNLTNVLMVWVFLGHVLRCTSGKGPIFEGVSLNKIILFFCAMGAISLLRTGSELGSWYVAETVTSLKRWLTPMFMYFLALNVAREKREIKALVVIIMVAVTVVGAMATWDYMNLGEGTSFEKSRIGGIAGHSNTLGAFFCYYMFLLLGFFLEFAGKLKAWALLVPFLICFRGIMVTFSRGAYLAFVAGSLAAAFFKSKTLFLIAAGLLAFAVTHPTILPKGIQYRMGMTVKGGELDILDEDITQNLEVSAARRVEVWRGALRMIRENPVWGVGYGRFPRLAPQYTDGAIGHMDAHNSYLLIAAEMGIPTLLVFLLILLMAAYYTRWVYVYASDRFFRATALGFQAGLVGLLVANLFGSRINSQELSSYFWILAGLMVRMMFIEKRGEAGGKGRQTGAKGNTESLGVVKGAWD